MSGSDPRVAQIEARLAAAPSWPWHWEGMGEHGYPQRISNSGAVLIAETFFGGLDQVPPEAEFIAHAPEDMRYALDEVTELRSLLALANRTNDEAYSMLNDLRAELADRDAEIARHHADFERWETMADDAVKRAATAVRRAEQFEAELADTRQELAVSNQLCWAVEEDFAGAQERIAEAVRRAETAERRFETAIGLGVAKLVERLETAEQDADRLAQFVDPNISDNFGMGFDQEAADALEAHREAVAKRIEL